MFQLHAPSERGNMSSDQVSLFEAGPVSYSRVRMTYSAVLPSDSKEKNGLVLHKITKLLF